MAEIEKKPVKIVETILRDAHQSLIATRMTTEQMLPIIEKMDQVGYHAVECWGGATFDASLRFLKEDPWERLRKFRDGFKNTKLQMLFRGQNILGYRPYADDVVEYFVQKSAANGIDIIRIFDCLNDIRNLKTAVTAANKEKAHAQVAMSYTLGDAYTLDYWVDLAKRIEDMGANSICVKDMAGLLLPKPAYDLVKAIKEEGYDSAATRRVTRKGEPPIRSFFARMFYKIMNKISDTELMDGARDYRLMTRQFVNSLLEMKEYNRFSKGLFGWVGYQTKWIEFENVERVAGETKWSFWKLLLYAIDGVVAFSTAPLAIASVVGMLMLLVAFIFIIFIIVRTLIFNDPTSGWPSLVCIITLIGGIQIFCVGIVGEYLSKIYLETKNRPVYIVKEDNLK